MPYSKLINIKKNKVNDYFNIYINKTFKFRIVTLDNKKGIRLNIPYEDIVNGAQFNGHYWYTYNEKINYDNLSEYQYFVLQIISDKNYKEFDIDINDSFTITNKNDWYFCDPGDPNCNLEFYMQDILDHKPIQEVNDNLIYKITGSASIKKNKYIRSGKKKSTIRINGLYPNMINYRYSFELNNGNVKDTKNKCDIVKSINNFTNIDKILSSDNLGDVNSRIEMLKYQLKNYFIENNEHLGQIESEITETQKQNDNNTKIVNEIEFKVSEYNNIFAQIIEQAEECQKKVSDVTLSQDNQNDAIKSLFILTDDFQKFKTNFENIKLNLETNDTLISDEINKLKNTTIKNKDSIDKNKDSIDKNKDSINKNKDSINKNKDSIDESKININDNKDSIELNSKNISKHSVDILNIINNIKIIEQKILSIENNISSVVDKIYVKINQVESSTEKTITDTTAKLDEKIKNTLLITDKINNTVVNNLDEFNSYKTNIEDKFALFKNDYDNLISQINTNNNSFVINDTKLKEHTDINKNKIEIIKDKLNELIITINNNEQINIDQKENINKLKKEIDENYSTIINLIQNKPVFWSNSFKYAIDYHNKSITINFNPAEFLFIESSLYLLCDFYKEERPYYCSKVKKINNDLSVAKLISIIDFEYYYN